MPSSTPMASDHQRHLRFHRRDAETALEAAFDGQRKAAPCPIAGAHENGVLEVPNPDGSPGFESKLVEVQIVIGTIRAGDREGGRQNWILVDVAFERFSANGIG